MDITHHFKVMIANKTVAFIAFLIILVLVGCTQNGTQIIPPTVVLKSDNTPTPAISPTVTPTFVNVLEPTPSSILTSTVETTSEKVGDIQKVEYFLGRKSRNNDYIKILEYLAEYPNETHRQELLYKVTTMYNREWVLEDWLDEYILQPFELAGGLSPGFEEEWQNWGEVIEGDLDGNQDPDYVLTIKHPNRHVYKHLYWVHRIGNNYEIAALLIDLEYVHLYAFEDLTGDGQTELLYSSFAQGASTRHDKVHVISWRDGQLVDLFPFWMPQLTNGSVEIENEDGFVELILTSRSVGGMGAPPTIGYKVHYQLHSNGYYAPVRMSLEDETALWTSSPETMIYGQDALLIWQRAKYFLHTNQYPEALNEFSLLAGVSPAHYFIVNYTPYALFNVGIIHLIMGDNATALSVWEQLAEQFPDHPVGIDIVHLKDILTDKGNLMAACDWLDRNADRWKQINWMASDQLIYDSKRLSLVELEGVPPDEADKLLQSDAFNLTKERETIKYIATITRPPGHFNFDDWWGFCNPHFLLSIYEWQQQTALAVQMQQFGLGWQSLSSDYDLNNDAINDVIGLLETGGKESLWAFISDGQLFQPLFVMQPYPIDAVSIWDVDKYRYDFYISSDTKLKVIASESGHLAIVLDESKMYQWEGDNLRYVTFSNNIVVQDVDNSMPPADRAIELLFRYNQPQAAISILQEYKPANDAGEAMRLYLLGTALNYNKQYAQSQNIFEELVEKYPATDWALFSQEKSN